MKLRITKKMAVAFRVGTVLREVSGTGIPTQWTYRKVEDGDVWVIEIDGRPRHHTRKSLSDHIRINVAKGNRLRIEV